MPATGSSTAFSSPDSSSLLTASRYGAGFFARMSSLYREMVFLYVDSIARQSMKLFDTESRPNNCSFRLMRLPVVKTTPRAAAKGITPGGSRQADLIEGVVDCLRSTLFR